MATRTRPYIICLETHRSESHNRHVMQRDSAATPKAATVSNSSRWQVFLLLWSILASYSAVYSFWLVEEMAGLLCVLQWQGVGVYMYAPPHNDVSVDDGPHIRRWSHNII